MNCINGKIERPTIVCHMVASIDGRIDCAMVDQISDDEYYTALNKLNCGTWLNGRVTMEHYNAQKEAFVSIGKEPIACKSFFVAQKSEGYAISVDTLGTLRWNSNKIDDLPLLCIVSELATKEYLEYLRSMNISWIAVGSPKIDLNEAMCILRKEFDVERVALLGGGIINGGFLDAGLVDEVSLLLAPGIDGRQGRVALFDGIEDKPRSPFHLKLNSVEQFDNGTVWLRYNVLH